MISFVFRLTSVVVGIMILLVMVSFGMSVEFGYMVTPGDPGCSTEQVGEVYLIFSSLIRG